jgi:NAD(P)-dependent dehydrogenase (short-subunit alcohol dehydrogenase family)
MIFSLDGDVALIFGAGSSGPGWGNGKAAAVTYARAGAKVVCVDINQAAAEETAAIIVGEGYKAIALQGDVSSEVHVANAVSATVSHYGKIDILHNNTGITLFGGPTEQSLEDWDRAMDVNVKSIFLACRHALPHMIDKRRGVITNISSIAGIRVGGYNMTSYYTSKAAVNHLTKAIALEHAHQGIRCNAILPGLMNTPMIRGDMGMLSYHGDLDKQIAERNAMSPTGKMGDAWDVAYAAIFLASPGAKYINGILLPVDGGLTCRTR